MYYDAYEDMKKRAHGEYWFKGGRGSCKSSFAALSILRGILTDREANAVVYRRVAATLKDSVCAVFGWAVRELGLEEMFRMKTSPPELIYLPTGQRVLFRGADDPLKSKSIALTQGRFKYLWFEETAEFRREADLRCIEQSVLRGTDEGTVICTFNPPASASAWVNTACLSERPGRLVLHTTYLDVPKSWLGERFRQEAETLKKVNPGAYESEYLGKVTGEGGRVFENLELRTVSEGELAALDRRYHGLDFGFAVDPDAYTQWAYDRKNRALYAVDEYVRAGNSPMTLAEEVRKRAGKALITCDSAEPRMIQALRELGLNVHAARKGPGSREHGYRWLQTLGRIVVDPARTPVIAREMSGYEYERDRQGSYLSGYPDGNDHTLDSARYALESTMGRQAVTRSDVY